MKETIQQMNRILSLLVFLLVLVGATFAIGQYMAYKREVRRHDDLHYVKTRLEETAPSDVKEVAELILDHIIKNSKDFHSNRFTREDADELIQANNLVDPQKKP